MTIAASRAPASRETAGSRRPSSITSSAALRKSSGNDSSSAIVRTCASASCGAPARRAWGRGTPRDGHDGRKSSSPGRRDSPRFHDASTAPFGTCLSAAAMADIPLRKRPPEDAPGRTRTCDPLLRRSRVSPLWRARPTRSTRGVLATLSPSATWCGDLAARPAGARGARAGEVSPSLGQAQVGAQVPDPLDADQLRQALPGHRPLRSRRQADGKSEIALEVTYAWEWLAGVELVAFGCCADGVLS
jgi:hypothetical protein